MENRCSSSSSVIIGSISQDHACTTSSRLLCAPCARQGNNACRCHPWSPESMQSVNVLMPLLLVFLVAIVHLVGIVTIGSVFGISSLCGSGVVYGNATHSYYRPDEMVEADRSIAGITLPPDICQTLSNSQRPVSYARAIAGTF